MSSATQLDVVAWLVQHAPATTISFEQTQADEHRSSDTQAKASDE